MAKRLISVLGAIVLIGALTAGIPAHAQEAEVTIPDAVNIDDPVNDANYLNDQSLLTTIPPTQDNVTPADVGGTSDLMKIWYSHTAETISVNVQLQDPPPASQSSYIYRVYASPGEGSVTSSTLGCLRFFAFVPSATPPVGGYSGPQYAGLLDYCDKGTNYTEDAAEGEMVIGVGPDDTAVMTITVPRSYSEKLGDGQILSMPQAQVQHVHGTGTDSTGQPTGTDGNWRRGLQIDNTIIGTDYTITPVASEPDDDLKPGPGKGKGCNKGKGKKKGCKKGGGEAAALGGGSLRL